MHLRSQVTQLDYMIRAVGLDYLCVCAPTTRSLRYATLTDHSSHHYSVSKYHMWRWHLLGGALCCLASDTQSALTFICPATDSWYTFLQPSALSLHQGVHGTLKRLVFSIYPLILSPPVWLAWFSTCCFWCSLKVIVLGNKTLLLMPRLGQRAESANIIYFMWTLFFFGF